MWSDSPTVDEERYASVHPAGTSFLVPWTFSHLTLPRHLVQWLCFCTVKGVILLLQRCEIQKKVWSLPHRNKEAYRTKALRRAGKLKWGATFWSELCSGGWSVALTVSGLSFHFYVPLIKGNEYFYESCSKKRERSWCLILQLLPFQACCISLWSPPFLAGGTHQYPTQGSHNTS